MFDLDFACEAVEVCRDDNCDLDELHPVHDIHLVPRRRPPSRRTFQGFEPWKVTCSDALRDSTLRAVSAHEPRSFSTVLSHVQEDYGSCCPRSVHRHLVRLRVAGDIVRMEFGPHRRICAYLKSGSRLVREPSLVLDHILSFRE